MRRMNRTMMGTKRPRVFPFASARDFTETSCACAILNRVSPGFTKYSAGLAAARTTHTRYRLPVLVSVFLCTAGPGREGQAPSGRDSWACSITRPDPEHQAVFAARALCAGARCSVVLYGTRGTTRLHPQRCARVPAHSVTHTQ